MRKFALKAVLLTLTLDKTAAQRPDRDRRDVLDGGDETRHQVVVAATTWRLA